jgi:hypothetical protein
MNVDRVPDGPDDPGRAAETARLTESPEPADAPRPDPAPEHPTPDRQPPPDRQPDPEREPDREPQPDREHPPGTPQADSPEPAELRSRQEHARSPSIDGRKIPAEEVGDEDASVAAEAERAPDNRDGEPSSSDVTTQGQVRDDLSADRPGDDSPAEDLARQEGAISDESGVTEAIEQHDEESVEQEDRPSDEANDPSSVTQGEKASERPEVIPADDGPPALTDREWSEHVTEVRDTLDKARAAGLTTDRLYTIDPDHKEWSAERNRLQGSLVAELYERAQEVPCDRQAIVAGGLGGAGKTTVLKGHAGIDLSRYLTINPDDIKEEMARRGMIPDMDKLSPMEASDLAHEESSYIAKRLALRAMADGKNIIWDITMSSRTSTEERINNLRDAAYERVDGVFVDIPLDTSVTRTELRHREGHEQWRASQGFGGRFVPPEVIQRQLDSEFGSQNHRTYEAMKEKFTSWSIYDNSVDGRSPALIDSREQEKPSKTHRERPT